MVTAGAAVVLPDAYAHDEDHANKDAMKAPRAQYELST